MTNLTAELPPGLAMSPVYHGDPDEVTEAVLADPGPSVADELVLFLPPAFGLAENIRLLTDLAGTVARAQLGSGDLITEDEMMTIKTSPEVLDPTRLRQVFGAYPSGVTSLAALIDDAPVGLTASSFTSVSLEPALVSVCIGRFSSTWSILREAPRLGVSILSAEQAHAGRQLAARGVNRFAGLDWRATADGAVLLDGATGWLDTSIVQQVPAGDHDIIVLAVHDLDADHDIHPLVFHASRFRRLEP